MDTAAAPVPIVNISVIRPKAGRLEDFMALQLEQQRRVRGRVDGLRGARLFQSEEGVVLISVFDSVEQADAFRRDPMFTDHIARVRPLIETSEVSAFTQAYAVGEI